MFYLYINVPQIPSLKEHQYPKGLQMMAEGWKPGKKRNADSVLENQNNRKKRRKQKYEVMDENCGLGNGEDF